MTYLGWMALVGAVLLFMGLASAYLRRLPITAAGLYILLGLALSPAWLGLLAWDIAEWSEITERLTELAVIVSLFVGGLKLRLPLRDPTWSPAYRLAAPVMVTSIVGVAAVSHFLLGLSWPAAFILGAVLAPTDPVLAGSVSVNNSADHDRVRYGLSGEAGFNDGTAFPFVIFGLLWLETGSLDAGWIGFWSLERLLWAVPAGLFIGYLVGVGVGHLAIWLRSRHRETQAPNDFLALAVIALVYSGAESVHAWGFLAAFAAGLGFRRAERHTSLENPIVNGEDSSASVRLAPTGTLPRPPLRRTS